MTNDEKVIVVVGSCNIDLTSVVSEFPTPGQTVLSTQFSMYAGGKGLNQAVKCAEMLGCTGQVVMIGKVGDDDGFSDILMERMNETRVCTDFVVKDETAKTGSALIFVRKASGENMIVVNAGANSSLNINDVLRAEPIIASKKCKVVVCQLEIPISTVFGTLKLARDHSTTTLLNAAPIVPNLDRSIFNYVDVLCVNEIEASALTGIKDVESDKQLTVDALLDLSQAIKIVVVTVGPRGAFYADRENNRVRDQKPSEKIDAADTTGAGDAFVAALAFYLATSSSQLPIDDKIFRSCNVATNYVRTGRKKH